MKQLPKTRRFCFPKCWTSVWLVWVIGFTACSGPDLTVKNHYNRMIDQWSVIGESVNQLQRDFMLANRICARVEREIVQVTSHRASEEKPLPRPELLIYAHQNYCNKIQKIAAATGKTLDAYRKNQQDFNEYYRLVIADKVDNEESDAEMKIFQKKYNLLLKEVDGKRNEFTRTVDQFNENIDKLNAFFDAQPGERVVFKGEKIYLK